MVQKPERTLAVRGRAHGAGRLSLPTPGRARRRSWSGGCSSRFKTLREKDKASMAHPRKSVYRSATEGLGADSRPPAGRSSLTPASPMRSCLVMGTLTEHLDLLSHLPSAGLLPRLRRGDRSHSAAEPSLVASHAPQRPAAKPRGWSAGGQKFRDLRRRPFGLRVRRRLNNAIVAWTDLMDLVLIRFVAGESGMCDPNGRRLDDGLEHVGTHGGGADVMCCRRGR